MTVPHHKLQAWYPETFEQPWPITPTANIVAVRPSHPEPEPARDPNEISFLGRTFTRTPKGKQALAFIVGCWAILAITFSSIPGPPKWTPPKPAVQAQPIGGWPAGTSAREMCAADGGIWELEPVGGATRRNPLPPGSGVTCRDGADASVAVG